jgi:octaprenyl-diphosphate synthase
LGIAFQIVDDLLDVAGNESDTGKSLGTDLDQQKPTLPIIRLLSQLDGQQREEVLGILQSDECDRRQALAPWFEQTDALPYARQRAHFHAGLARAELDGVEPSAALVVLRDLTGFVVQRVH